MGQRIYYIDQHRLLKILNAYHVEARGTGRSLKVAKIATPLPADARVTHLFVSHERGAIGIVVESEEFDAVLPCERIPEGFEPVEIDNNEYVRLCCRSENEADLCLVRGPAGV